MPSFLGPWGDLADCRNNIGHSCFSCFGLASGSSGSLLMELQKILKLFWLKRHGSLRSGGVFPAFYGPECFPWWPLTFNGHQWVAVKSQHYHGATSIFSYWEVRSWALFSFMGTSPFFFIFWKPFHNVSVVQGSPWKGLCSIWKGPLFYKTLPMKTSVMSLTGQVFYGLNV